MPIYDDLDDQGSEADFLEGCRRDFEATGNPLYAWQALGMVFLIRSRRLKNDFPDSFTKLPRYLARRQSGTTDEDSRHDFLREAHMIVTGASRIAPTPEHLDALWEFYELPEWLADYLAACSRRLLGSQPKLDQGRLVPEEKPPKGGEGPGAFGAALGFSEGLKLAREHAGAPWNEQERLALDVVEYMYQNGVSLNRAAEKAQESRRASKSAAERAVRKANSYALRRMQSYLREATGSVPDRDRVVRAFLDLCRSRAK